MFQAPVSREVTAADVVADLRYLADPASVTVMDTSSPRSRWRPGPSVVLPQAIEGTDEPATRVRALWA